MKSTVGRPRALTDAQVRIILKWHWRYLRWKAEGAQLKSQRALARELRVSQSTISHVVRRGGCYKQVGPEGRVQEIQRRQRERLKLRRDGFL